ncbi:MAG TPA: glycine--tRNA ligase subunit beta, partial [Deltaproteobacteria bacterium]|nr:glycine--tRNA ligase subunit beta [Deltaproteobacteria bacterium]
RFFFEEDRKVGLKNLSEKLSSVTFHVRLGTMEEKTKRIEAIALYLAKILGYNNVEKIKKAVRMIKADLLTHMVREFPELQGTMGRIYALHEGEDEEIAYAIEEHYLPSG